MLTAVFVELAAAPCIVHVCKYSIERHSLCSVTGTDSHFPPRKPGANAEYTINLCFVEHR